MRKYCTDVRFEQDKNIWRRYPQSVGTKLQLLNGLLAGDIQRWDVHPLQYLHEERRFACSRLTGEENSASRNKAISEQQVELFNP